MKELCQVLDFADKSNSSPSIINPGLGEIEQLDSDLSKSFDAKFVIQPSLTRSLVSFQANKTRAVYRWYKYKEAFSAVLVEHLLHKFGITSGKVLDPFAGSGTALFVASELGVKADGIELLPIGQQIIETKKLLEADFTPEDFSSLRQWVAERPWNNSEDREALPELRITKGAYPQQTRDSIERYVGACWRETERVKSVLVFALLCVLESISYTRKDGQYLRSDYRSGRGQGQKPFDKGLIADFDRAVCDKIGEIVFDLKNQEEQGGCFRLKLLRVRFIFIMAHALR